MVLLLIGQPGSGKSTFIERYILEQHKKVFDMILYTTPSGFDNIPMDDDNRRYNLEESWLM